jgi:hypothetical protein
VLSLAEKDVVSPAAKERKDHESVGILRVLGVPLRLIQSFVPAAPVGCCFAENNFPVCGGQRQPKSR